MYKYSAASDQNRDVKSDAPCKENAQLKQASLRLISHVVHGYCMREESLINTLINVYKNMNEKN